MVEAILAALSQSLEVQADQMAWCVAMPGAAMRSVLPVLEGMTQAGVDAGLSPETARRVAGQVMLGTAALALQTDLSFDQIKSLTPMQTIDEAAVAEMFRAAARQTRDKSEQVLHKR